MIWTPILSDYNNTICTKTVIKKVSNNTQSVCVCMWRGVDGGVCVCLFVVRCVCVCSENMWSHLHVSVRVCMCVCARVCVHAFDFFLEITCISMCMYVCLCVWGKVCANVYVCMCVCLCVWGGGFMKTFKITHTILGVCLCMCVRPCIGAAWLTKRQGEKKREQERERGTVCVRDVLHSQSRENSPTRYFCRVSKIYWLAQNIKNRASAVLIH